MNKKGLNAMISYPIYDLHCDLLLYLAIDGGKATDSQSRCSLPQLIDGGVSFQTFAIFSETKPVSVKNCEKQIKAFNELTKQGEIIPCKKNGNQDFVSAKKITAALAIENASCLVLEDEPLELALMRLDRLENEVGKVLYITMTWNDENRFGGGAATDQGIKNDGKLFLEMLSGKKIAIDLSHTSDQLAWDILRYLDTKGP